MQERFQQGVARAHAEAAFFEGHLGDGRSYLAGDMFTLADINLAIAVYFGQRGGATFSRYPRLIAYAASLQDRPCFKDNHPSNWLALPNCGWLTDL